MNWQTRNKLDTEQRSLDRMNQRIKTQKPITQKQFRWWKTLRGRIEAKIQQIRGELS